MTEVALDGLAKVREHQLFGLHRDRARLDLRQIQDVADQIQQIGTRTMDRLREFDLTRRQIRIRVLGELLTQDQDAVERCSQLVRHVREELRLVARGEGELGRLLFERATSHFDFHVLALDFRVLLGQQPRLVRKLLVRLLKLLLLRLQFRSELLRLSEQTFGTHRRLDRVQHHADRIAQLIHEHEMRHRERLQ